MLKQNLEPSFPGPLETLFDAGTLTGLTDGQLLARFTNGQDGSAHLAFAALVERHGRTVLRVCLGVLRDRHDAEDAFQATFLVLAQQAGSIQKPNSVASWLYGVAFRVATKCRINVDRRRVVERRAFKSPVAEGDDWEALETAALVHEEVAKLPERYRVPVLLCGLEGVSPEQAACQLGWPVGTVKSRLARGRSRLRDRLARRGLVRSAGFSGVPPIFQASLVSLPTALTQNVTHDAIRLISEKALPAGMVGGLTKGVLRAMFWDQMKVATFAVISLAALGIGTGVSLRGEADSPPTAPHVSEKAVPQETAESAWLHRVFSREISDYHFFLDAEKQRKLVMIPEPILRFPSPADSWGELYLWTDRQRPAVVGCVFAGKVEKPLYRIFHEFQSLSSQPLFASGGATGWQPERAAITFKRLPDTAEPAKDDAGRLKQMAEFAGRFSSCMIWVDTMLDLEPMPKPLYRYQVADKDSPVIDGTLFTFSGVNSKDPEVLLMIEAQRTNDTIQWHYAAARLTNRKVWLKYRGVEVWRAEPDSPGIFDGVTTEPYGTFLVKSIKNEEDEQ